MNISAARFEFALSSVKASDWEHFERLCSAFLVSDFPGLRTMASPGGDRGRDAELYRIDSEPNVLFQFSVTESWKSKIKDTLDRIKGEFQDVTAVVFLSSRQIGAQGDKARNDARKNGIALDIRDRTWFVERFDSDDSRMRAATDFARAVADPILQEQGLIRNSTGLKQQEAKTALVFLELQAKDENVEKGLTKSCYESLVRAVLHGSSASQPVSRADIDKKIGALLPNHESGQLQPFISAALKRLDKKVVKHLVATDEYHISFEEVERTKDRIAGLALLQQSFKLDVDDIVSNPLNGDEVKILKAQEVVREILETYFFRLGEEFAQSVAGGRPIPLDADLLKNIVIEHAPQGRARDNEPWSNFLYSTVTTLIASPSEQTTEFFRVLSTAYTLFAFLSEVPDVQRATKKLFEHGTLWFDTTALLPLIAEEAFPSDMRPFSDLILQLRRTGLKLRVTLGVVEEIERHLNLCQTYLRTPGWKGRVPYVYQRYALAGGTSGRFAGWLEQFVGQTRPLEDLAQYLSETAEIEVEDVPSLEKIPDEVTSEIREYWQTVQDRRRGAEASSIHAYRLAEHDSENYLSVLAERRTEVGKALMGYTSWLVTMDSAAWRLLEQVTAETAGFIKHSPVISLDFLIKVLSFGPRRDRVDTSKKGYSRVFAATIFENIPQDLMDVAQQVRESCHGLSERLVQRRIRDELDRQRMKVGAMQTAGLDGLETVIQSMY